jgi:hypothetical protein
MQLRHATLVTAVALGLISYLTYLQLQRPDESTQGTSVVPVNRSMTATDRGEATNVVELSALREQVASLRAEVLASRHQAKQTETVTAESEPVPDVRHDPNARAEAARQQQAEMEAVDTAFSRQAVDPTWSATTASTIREVLSSDEVGGIQAENIDCRSTGCRIALLDDGSGRLSRSLPIVGLQLAGQFSSMTANTIPQGNGSSTLVLYMSRSTGVQAP